MSLRCFVRGGCVAFVALLALLFYVESTNAAYPKNPANTTLTRIAFGSCNKIEFPQPIWDEILAYKPDLWVWLGDIVYADVKVFFGVFKPAPIESVQRQYKTQYNLPAYAKLRKETPVVGVWDDHDYGLNDGDHTFVNKHQVKDILLDFLEEPLESTRRQHGGVYSSYVFGQGDKTVKVILLDVRWFKNQEPNDILGSEQWAWLESELRSEPTTLTLIGSGVQLIPDDRPKLEGYHSHGKQRMAELIKKTQRPGVLFISGDVHFGEIMVDDCPDRIYPLYEVTSSGMTHSCNSIFKFLFCTPLMWLLPYTFQETDRYVYRNFGLIEIDWNTAPVSVSLQVHNVRGEVVIKKAISVDELQPNAPRQGSPKHCRNPDDPYLWWYARAAALIALYGSVSLLLAVSAVRVGLLAVRKISRIGVAKAPETKQKKA